MLWRVIQVKVSLLGCEFRKLINLYNKNLNRGIEFSKSSKSDGFQQNLEKCDKLESDESSQPRSEYCSNLINIQFGIAITGKYIREYFSEERLNTVS